MKLPSLEEYINTAQLEPSSIFSDPIFKNSKIQKNAYGLPRIRSGNFAIIFKTFISDSEFAVRCFLKMSETSEIRYSSIQKKINQTISSLDSSVFAKFSYQKQGILVNEKYYPILIMKWLKGPTLGEFINREYRNTESMLAIKKSLRELFFFLKVIGCAHGDIQPGNLIVNDNGNAVKLIDYDGMYVSGIESLGAIEIGHINFQHPMRNKSYFSPHLDFFSFILLDTVITCLINNPDLWDESFSDEEGILFRAEDLRNPISSLIFDAISKTKNCRSLAQNFASICLNNFENIPDPSKFYKDQIISKTIIIFNPEIKKINNPFANKSSCQVGPYISSNTVINANEIKNIIKNIGKRIELIGKVHEVRIGKSQFGNSINLRPYIYLDFSPMSSGTVLRVKFLPDIIEDSNLSKKLLPNQHWTGKWVTVTESIQPIQRINHPSFIDGLIEISIIIINPNQIRVIAESEANYRLGGKISDNQEKMPSKSIGNQNSLSSRERNKSIVNVLKNL